MIRIILYQPDIPQNLGAVQRLGACLGLPVAVIGPCGFPLDDQRMRRVLMDYWQWLDFQAFHSLADLRTRQPGRLVLIETDGAIAYDQFTFQPGDQLIFGRESRGSPPELRAMADAALRIPMAVGPRSLNLAAAVAIVAGEALRQLRVAQGAGAGGTD